MNNRTLSCAILAPMLWLASLLAANSQSLPATYSGDVRFMRGTGTDTRYYSMVVPLSGQQAAPYALNIAANYYHLNATNSGSQNYITNRLLFNSVAASFGSFMSGPALYLNQSYRFGIYAGDPTLSASWTNAVQIAVYARSNSSLIATMAMSYPDAPYSNQWNQILTNGFTSVVTGYGLTTILYQQPDTIWGNHIWGECTLTHTATGVATNYFFIIYALGTTDKGYMTVDQNANWTWEPIYTVDFTQRPPTRVSFVDQAQFQGKPMPSEYAAKSLPELLAVHATVTNAVSSAATNWLDLDNSP